MSNEQWNPYGGDPDPEDETFITTGDLKRAATQYEFHRRATEFYYGLYPQDAHASALVQQVAYERAARNPELLTKRLSEDEMRTLAGEVHGEVERRAQAALQPPTAERRGGYRDYEPSDADRAEAIREEEERYYRAKQPPR